MLQSYRKWMAGRKFQTALRRIEAENVNAQLFLEEAEFPLPESRPSQAGDKPLQQPLYESVTLFEDAAELPLPINQQ